MDAQSTLPLAQLWGGGHVASADGLRFIVSGRSANAAPNSRYFGMGRGLTYYNLVSDQHTGFHAVVVPGTLRDSLFVLDGLLEHRTRLEPDELMADTAAYSDVVFGLFWLLGYQFSPRLRDIADLRYWRLDRSPDYGRLDGLARAIFFGRRGELRQPYRQGQENQLGALGLVVNIVALWNTVYTGDVLAALADSGTTADPADVARLSPLGHAHINLLGHYHFRLPDGLVAGARRTICLPDGHNAPSPSR